MIACAIQKTLETALGRQAAVALIGHALADIAPRRSFYVYGGSDRFPMTTHTEAISLPELAAELAALR